MSNWHRHAVRLISAAILLPAWGCSRGQSDPSPQPAGDSQVSDKSDPAGASGASGAGDGQSGDGQSGDGQSGDGTGTSAKSVETSPREKRESDDPLQVPEVQLPESQAALCKVQVGDKMPEIELPGADGKSTKLADLYGERLTVVCFLAPTGYMSTSLVHDLGPDIIEPEADRGVAVVGIVVGKTVEELHLWLEDQPIDFPVLADAQTQALELVGTERVPRVYVLDPQGQILWFDIQYSRSTRRDLQQTIDAVLGPAANGDAS